MPLHELPWAWKALALAGMMIVCAVELEESSSMLRTPAEAATPVLVDINFGTERELDSLPGVGPALARAIMASRPYSRPEELDRVKGISPKMAEMLRPLIKAGQGRRKADHRL